MPETTEQYHRIPVSEGHGDHEIRTISISDDDGIKALYCVDCKEVITYLFDVDEWTMEDAQEWVDEHKDSEKARAAIRLDRRAKEIIGSQVRYKSYGDIASSIKGVTRTDDGALLVPGIFTSDTQDEVGDIITREATESAVAKWRRWGNIRTMHDYPSGKVVAIGTDDGLAWNELVTTPIDEGTRALIEGGVLQAYSVGIIPRRYELNEAALTEDEDPWFFPLVIHEYDMIEISYVDHPANYAATIQQAKEAGDTRKVIFKRLPGEDNEPMFDTVNDVVEGEEPVAEMIEPATDVEKGEGEVVATEPVGEDLDSMAAEPVLENEVSDDPEFDVALVVRDLEARIEEIEAYVAEGLPEQFMEAIVERVIDRIYASQSDTSTAEDAEVGEANVEQEVGEPQHEPEIGLSLDVLLEKISDMLDSKIEALRPAITSARSASVAVGELDKEVTEDNDSGKSLVSASQEERRAKLRRVVDKMLYGEED